MKNTIIAVALFLGLSVAGYSQTVDVTGTITLEDGREMIIENPNVTVVPGESVYVHSNGTDQLIIVKGNGEYVGRIGGIGGAHVGQSQSIKIKTVATDETGVDITGDRKISN